MERVWIIAVGINVMGRSDGTFPVREVIGSGFAGYRLFCRKGKVEPGVGVEASKVSMVQTGSGKKRATLCTEESKEEYSVTNPVDSTKTGASRGINGCTRSSLKSSAAPKRTASWRISRKRI